MSSETSIPLSELVGFFNDEAHQHNQKSQAVARQRATLSPEELDTDILFNFSVGEVRGSELRLHALAAYLMAKSADSNGLLAVENFETE